MEAHEKKCSRNPSNIRACFFCSNCVRVNIHYEPNVSYYQEDNLLHSSSFKCKAKDIFMYPPKFENSGKGGVCYAEYNGKEITQEPMPKECDLLSSVDIFDNILFND